MKAYTLDLSRINEGYLYDAPIVHGKTRGEAKKNMLKEIKYDNYQMRNGEEMNFLNIPLVRAKEYDKRIYDGDWKTEKEIMRLEFLKSRSNDLNKILENPEVTHCYIMKFGQYYADNHCGYTNYKRCAGIYEKMDAVKSGKACDDLTIIPIDPKEHNSMINKEIEFLNKRLLN